MLVLPGSVAELACAADLKSAGLRPCGFESHRSYHRDVVEKYHTAFGKQRRRGSTFHPDRRISLVVEQGFCKSQVTRSSRVFGLIS